MGGHAGPQPKSLTLLLTYLSFAILLFLGHFRDFFRTIINFVLRLLGAGPIDVASENNRPGYAPLVKDFSEFFTRRLYRRSKDCWNRPITGVAGAHIDVLERVSTDYNKTTKLTGNKLRCINLGSYNYLGFADLNSPCQAEAIESLEKYGAITGSTMDGHGYTQVHKDLEDTVAKFTGKEAAIVFGMGFATNSLGIPALVGKGSLIISDTLNHTSIVMGARSSGAKVRVYKHNNFKDLEEVLRTAIVEGQPGTHRPWNKIIIIVEGIYSMEGELCPMKELVDLKRKYKTYLYVDEAHSIGAMGSSGRGALEFWGVNPADVDIMMGTFTKSFGSVGGYIAGDKKLIDYLRVTSAGLLHADSMSVTCTQQCLSAFNVIMGKTGGNLGRQKIKQLHDNANYMRAELTRLGFEILGDQDSPIIPIMIYNPGKISWFSRECLKRGVAVVVVGFPATSVTESRVRLCLSAAHTREDIDRSLQVISEVGDIVGLKYEKNSSADVASRPSSDKKRQ